MSQFDKFFIENFRLLFFYNFEINYLFGILQKIVLNRIKTCYNRTSFYLEISENVVLIERKSTKSKL